MRFDFNTVLQGSPGERSVAWLNILGNMYGILVAIEQN